MNYYLFLKINYNITLTSPSPIIINFRFSVYGHWIRPSWLATENKWKHIIGSPRKEARYRFLNHLLDFLSLTGYKRFAQEFVSLGKKKKKKQSRVWSDRVLIRLIRLTRWKQINCHYFIYWLTYYSSFANYQNLNLPTNISWIFCDNL